MSELLEPVRTMRAAGYPWGHEVRVALPASYASGTQDYPVLWLMGHHYLRLLQSMFGRIEVILVSISAEPALDGEPGDRAAYDFYEPEDFYPGGPNGRFLRHALDGWGLKGGGAARLLDFIVDEVRPALAEQYRMDANDQGLFGCSAGGAFVGRAIFARPGAFSTYICASPVLYAGSDAIFDLEERYAAEYDDLPAHILFGAGDLEMTEQLWSGFGFVSSMARMAETLSCRNYPSTRLSVKLFPGETHATAGQLVLSWALRSAWPTATALAVAAGTVLTPDGRAVRPR